VGEDSVTLLISKRGEAWRWMRRKEGFVGLMVRNAEA